MSAPRNYGRKAPTPFDRLINQQCQKGVSSSKSGHTGVVGKWNTYKASRNGGGGGGDSSEPPKKKKFFKSRNPEITPASPNPSSLYVEDNVITYKNDSNPVVLAESPRMKVPPLKLKINTSSIDYSNTEEHCPSGPTSLADLLVDEETPVILQDENRGFKSRSPEIAALNSPQIINDEEENIQQKKEEEENMSDSKLFITDNFPSESNGELLDSKPSFIEEISAPIVETTETVPEIDRERRKSSSREDTPEIKPVPHSSESAPIVKTRSIFRSKTGGSRKARYNHQWNSGHEQERESKEETESAVVRSTSLPVEHSDFDEFSDWTATRVQRSDSAGVSVTVPRATKSYFTVIKNVKKAHQIQDSGEYQEFNDEVEYIMDGIGSSHSLSTRCLSTITLASKCMESSFRMHLRAHGTMAKFFKELKDAPERPSLALCAATVLFVISQDTLNMDLDRDSLGLMLNLLATDSKIKDALDSAGLGEKELSKNKQKVVDLCEAMKAKGYAKTLSLDRITADHLAMETLLSLTSKRAGEWFKEELRQLGGLDYLVNTLSDCVTYLKADEITMWTEPLLTKIGKAGRVLKVMENVTHDNEENCVYLTYFENGKCFDVVHSLLCLLNEEVPLHPNYDSNEKESTAFVLCQVLMNALRVYINLVHDYQNKSTGSKIGGTKEKIMDVALHILFVIPTLVPDSKGFDLEVLALTFIINLIENSVENRILLINTPLPKHPDSLVSEKVMGIKGLVDLFYKKEDSAKKQEAKTSNLLDGVKDEEEEKEKQQKSQEEVIDDTVTKVLHKAGRHMEDTLIASYITLVIGYLILDSKENEATLRKVIPDNNFNSMVTVLKQFFNFMNLTASSSLASSRGIKATEKIIKYLEAVDKPTEPEIKAENDSFDDDITLFEMTKDDSEVKEEDDDDVNATSYQQSCFNFENFGKI